MSDTNKEANIFDSVTQHRKDHMHAADMRDWGQRLERLIQSQAGVIGPVVISNLQPPSVGNSAGMVIFKAEFDDGKGRKDRDLVLRTEVEGGLFHSYDLAGQYKILKGLREQNLRVPDALYLDADGEILGAPGFVMEYIQGKVPPPSFYSNGVLYEATVEERRQIVSDIIAELSHIHSVDWRSCGLGFLEQRGNGSNAIERDLDWQWNAMLWGCPESEQELAPIRQWLLANQPKDLSPVLNHGDTSLHNYMFRDNRLVAVLDWELAFLGNRANDISFQVFGYQALGVGQEPMAGIPTEREWREEYEEISKRKLSDWDYYFLITVFKIQIDMLLTFRHASPELEKMKDIALGFTTDKLMERWGKCKLSS